MTLRFRTLPPPQSRYSCQRVSSMSEHISAGLPVSERTTLELILTLEEQGWSWHEACIGRFTHGATDKYYNTLLAGHNESSFIAPPCSKRRAVAVAQGAEAERPESDQKLLAGMVRGGRGWSGVVGDGRGWSGMVGGRRSGMVGDGRGRCGGTASHCKPTPKKQMECLDILGLHDRSTCTCQTRPGWFCKAYSSPTHSSHFEG